MASRKGAVVAIEYVPDKTFLVGQEGHWACDYLELFENIPKIHRYIDLCQKCSDGSFTTPQLEHKMLPLATYESAIYGFRNNQQALDQFMFMCGTFPFIEVECGDDHIMHRVEKVMHFHIQVLNTYLNKQCASAPVIHFDHVHQKKIYEDHSAGSPRILCFMQPRIFIHGKFGFPKGGSIKDENPRETAMRELYEELGWKCKKVLHAPCIDISATYKLYIVKLTHKKEKDILQKILAKRQALYRGEMKNFTFQSLSFFDGSHIKEAVNQKTRQSIEHIKRLGQNQSVTSILKPSVVMNPVASSFTPGTTTHETKNG